MSTIADTMREVALDAERDASRLDGMPFTGANVARVFGETLAMLAAVAQAVALLAEQLESRT